MNRNDETIFWKKKEFISFVLSILVLFIHSFFAPSPSSESFISLLNHKFSFFFSRSITQFAVPMFYILSGISFFRCYTPQKYITKIKSRIFTLVIPYIFWNTIWMLWEIFCSYSFLANFSAATEPYPLNLASILKGIFFYGCNTPFWFIFNLIIFSFAAPLFYCIIKNKYIGITTIIILSILSLFGIYLPMGVFYYPMSVVFYLSGAIIGYHYFHSASKKSSNILRLISVIWLSAYILLKNIVPVELQIHNFLIETIVYSLAAFSLWNITDCFIDKINPRAIYKRSFAIYAMHLNIAIIVLKILSAFTANNEWLEIPKFIVMVMLTIIIINVFCYILERYCPKIYCLIMGNRLN